MLNDLEVPQVSKLVGKAIKKARIDQDLDQAVLAERAGMSVSYLSMIERGARGCSTKALIRIAAALGMRVTELLTAARPMRGDSPALETVIEIGKLIEQLVPGPARSRPGARKIAKKSRA